MADPKLTVDFTPVKEDEAVTLELTWMPCGAGCGATYQVVATVAVAVIQKAALHDGWGVAEIEGAQVIVCPKCLGATAGGSP